MRSSQFSNSNNINLHQATTMPPHTTCNANIVVSNSAEHAETCLAPSSKGPLTPLPKATGKSVSFNERVWAKKTIHCNDFSEEEIQSYWYCDEGFRRIKREVKFEANLLENQCIEESSKKYCSRGLEYFTHSGSKVRRINKSRARSLVMEEQELQRDEGSNDPEYIAEVYAFVAADCKADARAFAQLDRLHAMQQ
jgi:hypothetical protein